MAYPTPTKKPIRPAGAPSVNQGSGKSSGGGAFKSVITLLAILIIVVGGVSLLKGSYAFKLSDKGGATFSGEWQAVFLTNGQVYFGKVTSQSRESINLEDIYYLQVVNQPLQKSLEAEEAGVDLQQEQRLTLIKLGNELHGPTDSMIINRDHVILMEDLRDDSRVVQAISDYVANGQTQGEIQ